MRMDVVEKAIEELQQRGALPRMARETGIPPKTLRNLKYRITTNPGWNIVKILQQRYGAK
jgi:hypothetical protein